MGRWSQDELNRTIDEVKRRSLTDPQFRALALSQPRNALARINPKPLPPRLSLSFIDEAAPLNPSVDSSGDIVVALPLPIAKADELSDDELEQAAGGKCDIRFPPE
jgi:hypothetical protein